MNWLSHWLKNLGKRRRSRFRDSLDIETLEDRRVLSGWRFDFGTSSSPVAAGFTQAMPVKFDAARGWGWETRSGLDAADRRVGDATAPEVTRDFHYGRDNTFRANVANGLYDVVLSLGDATSDRDRINIDLEGTRVATDIATTRGNYFRQTYRVNVSDGQLNLHLSDTGGRTAYWTINSLEIRPIATTETVATVGLTTGWATFGQALPLNTAFESLQVGTLPTQVDVKTRWPDGSIRFAVVTAEVTNSGNCAITPALASQGDVELDRIPVEVRFDIAPTNPPDEPLFVATLPPAAAPDELWLDGELVTESRWSAIPTDGSGLSLSGMRVLFDLRQYRDGSQRLAVTIENSDDTSENQLRNLAVQIWADADGNGLLDELLFDRSEVAMGSGTRFIQRFDFGLTASAVTPDFEPAFRSGALPRYATSVTNVVSSAFDVNGQLRTEFDLLGPGDLNPYMGSPGGRPDVAPYTDWTARYLVHREAAQADFLLRMGDLAASWPIHIREPSDGRLVSLAERPNFWFDTRGEDHMRSATWGGSSLSPDNAHVPGGLSLVPYLMTGDHFHADELAFWANYAVLSTWPGNSPTDDASRAGGNALAGSGRGILVTNQVRGFAWGLRNLADAAAYLPDSNPSRTEFQLIVRENLTWLDDWAKRKAGPLKMAWLPGYGTEVDGENQRFAQLWMYDYLAWSIHHATQLGFSGGTRFRDQVVRIQTELLVSSSFREFAAPGRLVIGQVSASGSTRTFSSFRDVLRSTQRGMSPGVFTGYYGVEARLALLIGIESPTSFSSSERSRMRAALNFLNNAALHPGMFDDPLTRSGFGLAGPDHP